MLIYFELAESISIAARHFTKKRLDIISVNLNGIPDSLPSKEEEDTKVSLAKCRMLKTQRKDEMI